MPGEFDQVYEDARRTLLDALVLDSALGREVGLVAIEYLASLFAKPAARGCQMAARALAPLQDPEETAAGCAALTTDLLLLVSPD